MRAADCKGPPPAMAEAPAAKAVCRAQGDIETESLAAHVALCRERYGTLNRRLLRLEILYGGLVTSLAAIAVRLWAGG